MASDLTSPRAEPVWPARVFVWTTYVVMLGAAVAFLATHSRNVPLVESWIYIPAYAGAEPVTPKWLWEPLYEHRFPVYRLATLLLFRLGYDVRAELWFNLLAAAVMAFLFVWTAERLRGRPSYTDAFFPLVLLHLGNWQLYLWDAMIAFTLPLLLTVAWLLLVLRGDHRLSLPTAILFGVCLVLLPLCGGWGMVPVVFALTWAVGAGFFTWRHAGPAGRRGLWVLAGCLGVSVVIIVLYLIDSADDIFKKTGPPGAHVLRTTVQFLCVSIGQAGRDWWPYSARGLLGFLAATVGLLAFAGWRRPRSEGVRAGGLLLFLAMTATMALAAARGRGAESAAAGFEGRYICGSVLWLCAAYFAWQLYAPPVVRDLAGWGLLTLAFGVVLFNGREGLRNGAATAEEFDRLLQNVRDGVPTSGLIKHHGGFLYSDAVGYPILGEGLRALRRSGVAPYDLLNDDYPFRYTAVPAKSGRGRHMQWEPFGDGARGAVEGEDSAVRFMVGRPRYICAVEAVWQMHRPEAGVSSFRVRWKPAGAPDAEWETKEIEVDAGGGTHQFVWICEEIGAFEILPDKTPGEFVLLGLRLIEPGDPDG